MPARRPLRPIAQELGQTLQKVVVEERYVGRR